MHLCYGRTNVRDAVRRECAVKTAKGYLMARKRTTSIVGGDRVGLDVAMLRCRTYGHAWDEFFPDNLGVPMFGWRLSLRCARCYSERHDIIDRNGAVGQRRYIYADDYHVARDETPTREQMRLSLFDSVRAQLDKAHAINDDIRSA
jgi:hypothetical protein